METSEVICAVSTAPGIGAIAVLRMSGAGCIALTDRIFESPSGKKLTGAKANTVHFGRILEEGCLLDEVLVTIFHAPHSYTGENSTEITAQEQGQVQGERPVLRDQFRRSAAQPPLQPYQPSIHVRHRRRL